MEHEHSHYSLKEKTTHEDEFGTRKVHYCACGAYRIEDIVEELSAHFTEWRIKNYNLED